MEHASLQPKAEEFRQIHERDCHRLGVVSAAINYERLGSPRSELIVYSDEAMEAWYSAFVELCEGMGHDPDLVAVRFPNLVRDLG